MKNLQRSDVLIYKKWRTWQITCERGNARQCWMGDERFQRQRAFFTDPLARNSLADRNHIFITITYSMSPVGCPRDLNSATSWSCSFLYFTLIYFFNIIYKSNGSVDFDIYDGSHDAVWCKDVPFNGHLRVCYLPKKSRNSGRFGWDRDGKQMNFSDIARRMINE